MGEANFTATACCDEFWKLFLLWSFILQVHEEEFRWLLEFKKDFFICNFWCKWYLIHFVTEYIYPDFIFAAITLSFQFFLCCQIHSLLFLCIFFPVDATDTTWCKHWKSRDLQHNNFRCKKKKKVLVVFFGLKIIFVKTCKLSKVLKRVKKKDKRWQLRCESWKSGNCSHGVVIICSLAEAWGREKERSALSPETK